MKKYPKIHRKIFLPFKKARKFVRSLKIPSQGKWWEYASSEKPSDIPAAPYRNKFKNAGDIN